MHMRPDHSRSLDSPSTPAQRSYRVLLRVEDGVRAERLIRRLIERTRGNLLAMERCGVHRHAHLHLLLGDRRVHDVITSLEAAGFAVNALVAS